MEAHATSRHCAVALSGSEARLACAPWSGHARCAEHFEHGTDAFDERCGCAGRGAHGGVVVVGTGDSGNGGGVGECEPAACGDYDAPCRLLDQAAQCLGASEHIGRAARGEHAVATGGDKRLQGFGLIVNFIECPMEADFEASGQCHQFLCEFGSYTHFRQQEADDDASCSQLLCLQDGGPGGTLGCRRDYEAFRSGPDQHVDRKPTLPHSGLDETGIGGESSDAELGTEFDAVGAAGSCSKAGGKIFCAEFKDDGTAQWAYPVAQDCAAVFRRWIGPKKQSNRYAEYCLH
jgi:hypothetical protein